MSNDKRQQTTGLSTLQYEYAAKVAQGNLTGAEAARQAGYSPSGARAAACRNNKIPMVQDLIDELREGHAHRNEIDADQVRAGLLEIARYGDSSASRCRAWELLGKTLGMFTDKTQVEHLPSFADEIEALQPKIRQAREEMKKRGGLRVVTQVRDAEEAEAADD